MLTVTVAGRVTKDAVLRYTTGANATPVLGFTVATDVGFGDKKHGVFIACSLWGKRGESLEAYIKKGTSLTVIGEGDLREWETQQSKGSQITCKVFEVTLQGKAQGGEQQQQARPSDQGFRNKPAQDKPVTGADFEDDDIPFN